MEIVQLFPLTAMFANFAAFFALWKDKDSFGNYFRTLLIVLAGGNLSLFFLLHSSSSEQAYLFFHVFRHFIFFVPPLLLCLSRILSGRKAESATTVGLIAISIGLIFMIEWDYFVPEKSVLIREWKSYSWGLFPVLEIQTRILVGGFFGIGFILSLFVLVKPDKAPVQGWIPFLVVCWWLGLGTNFLPLFGWNVFPLGMGADTIVSVFISVYLSRERAESFFHKVAELLASASVALGCGSLSVLFFGGESARFQTIFLSAVGVAASWIVLRLFRKKEKAELLNLTSLAQKGLTKQELRICELIAEGYTRKQIGFFLGIANGTLRNHLVNLYDKTIDLERNAEGKEKFQRLTVFLHSYKKP
ncbi:hypothetical protein EHQ12_12495 [Leptospira gomenensis]|uniref:HTH luxR-type domain-containing protein n=1 Tax=Leptospira gomenensis TaxID=2484974 RepID=A0A5F1Y9G5_9LEPT|nr:LuxR C-terminal-related transcriptional regulator [Leptospira gomenensis]TGK32751.1 hypothetical protein EHQ17_12340 [Leptospira gomenensis]TGK36899.1 hypothetical protein EHQ12_12495 [Leptospira gomenensis]TGK44370.1 hypothetical protein EHQ07_11810 [Leptospira gomenensis]TGK58863.1 hypothetical protein EHQ13_13630 [Leptospira gomenensis]